MTIQAQITLNNFDTAVTDPLVVLPALQAAFGSWSSELTGNATIQVTVNIKPFDTFLARCLPTFVPMGTYAQDGHELWEPDCAFQLINGSDPNGPATDMTIDINSLYLVSRPDQFWTVATNPPPPNSLEYDLFTFLTHEIGHGIAFAGAANGLPPNQESPFDEHTFLGFQLFDGVAADRANGGSPVPLSDDNGKNKIYHIAPSIPDLMNPNLPFGERLAISDLDIAILNDLGLESKVQGSIAGPPGTFETTWHYDFQPMSADGRFVVFTSNASNLGFLTTPTGLGMCLSMIASITTLSGSLSRTTERREMETASIRQSPLMADM